MSIARASARVARKFIGDNSWLDVQLDETKARTLGAIYYVPTLVGGAGSDFAVKSASATILYTSGRSSLRRRCRLFGASVASILFLQPRTQRAAAHTRRVRRRLCEDVARATC
jgi:hypothetical protein